MKIVLALLAALCLASCSKPANNQLSASSQEPPSIDAARLDPALAQTIAAAQQAVRAAPSAENWGKLGQAFEAAEFYSEAKLCYARAHELHPSSGKWLYLLALLQLADDPEAALQALEKAVELTPPTNDAPRLRLAQTLLERGKLDEAEKHLQRLLAANSAHPAARVEWARIQLARNNPGAAIDAIEPALTNAFTARPALLILAQARQRLGDERGASQAADRAASMPKPYDWPDPHLREVQSLRDNQQNIADRAQMLILQRRYDEAEQAINLLLANSPNNDEALLLLGRLRIQQRRCAEAEQALQRHLAVRTNSLQGHVQLGLARYCQERWSEAADAFRSALALKPDLAQAHYNLGLSLSRANDVAGAIEAFSNSLRAQPGDPNAHGALAEQLLRAGRRTEALREAEQALRLDPRQPRATAVRAALQQR